MTTPVLAAEGLHKSYRLGRTEIPVLKGVDLQVLPGEMVALLGMSGAGKSTLLHLLGLLDVPTGGAVRYDGAATTGLSAAARARLRHRHVGFVFQFYHLIPELTALQNVLLGKMMHRSVLQYLGERRQVKQQAIDLLTQVGLAQRLRHRPAELSGGERQRVAIARALMTAPRVILADEPTGNLDSATAEGVIELLFQINQERGIAFVIVTHNEDIAARCHRTVRLRDGRVVN
ncbi:MAG: ABC transporter ATP-binding protein [Planctomycetes bacterium]|nr:ABC transporter ATP-binding protein [Planctomycetota bacterium]